MKEEAIKKIIKESTVHTTPGFTDKLLLRIQREEARMGSLAIARRHRFRLALYGVAVLGIFFTAMFFLDLVPSISLGRYRLNLRGTPFLILILCCLFAGANQILKWDYLASRATGGGQSKVLDKDREILGGV